MELGIKNLIQYLAFDSNTIKTLLSDDNEKYFSAKFPIFYKDENGQSVLDICIQNNQIRSLNSMIEYMSKYQNSYVFSNLF